MTPVSSNYATHMDLYGEIASFWGAYGNNILAETRFFSGTGVWMSPNSADWFYADIHLNKELLPQYNIQGTIAHEMDHAFGLTECNANVNSIMCQTGFGRVVQTVQQTDNDAINIKY